MYKPPGNTFKATFELGIDDAKPFLPCCCGAHNGTISLLPFLRGESNNMSTKPVCPLILLYYIILTMQRVNFRHFLIVEVELVKINVPSAHES